MEPLKENQSIFVLENFVKTIILSLFTFISVKAIYLLYRVFINLPAPNNFSITEHGHLVSSVLQIILAILVISTGWLGWVRQVLKPRNLLKKIKNSKILYLFNDIFIIISFYLLLVTIDSGSSISSITADKNHSISFFPELVVSSVIMFFYLNKTLIKSLEEDQIHTLSDYFFFVNTKGKPFREPYYFSFIVFVTFFMLFFYNNLSIQINFMITAIIDILLIYFFWSYRNTEGRFQRN